MPSAHIDPSFSCAVRRQLLEPRCALAGQRLGGDSRAVRPMRASAAAVETTVGVAGKTSPEQFQTYMQVSCPRRVRVPVPRPLDRAVRCELPVAAPNQAYRSQSMGSRLAHSVVSQKAQCKLCVFLGDLLRSGTSVGLNPLH
jgi:hypothetical protein